MDLINRRSDRGRSISSTVAALDGGAQSRRSTVQNPNSRLGPHSCKYILGLPKLALAVTCVGLALLLVFLCIPLLLTLSRRRPPGAPLFDCSCSGQEEDQQSSYLKAILQSKISKIGEPPRPSPMTLEQPHSSHETNEQ